jgi:hypothetical protein
VLCDKGWKAIWDKLLASPHPNVQSSINVWSPPESGIRERIDEVHKKYPQGYEAKNSEKKKGTALWDEAEMALEKYQRIQRAKRKLLVVLMWISILQKSQKKVLEKKAKIEIGEDENSHPKSKVTIGETTTFVCRAESNDGENNTDCDDSAGDIVTIESLLSSSSNTLTKTQSPAPRQTLDVFDCQPSINTSNRRAMRRHTSAGLSINPKDFQFEEMPSFILKEYGGAGLFEAPARPSSAAKLSFKSAVNKVIKARRFINNLAQSPNTDTEVNLKLDHVPAEWDRLDKDAKETLAKKLSFKSVSSWDFNPLAIAELCNGAPLLFIGWAIFGSPHAQRAMAKDIGLALVEEDGYDFVNEFQIKIPVLCNFLRLTESNYLPNPYHNSTHASDVLATTNAIFQLGGNRFAESSLHVFSLLVAAVVHDVKHPGEFILLSTPP